MPEFTYKYNEEHIQYMKAQIAEIDQVAKGDLDYYSQLSSKEFKRIGQWIPKEAKSVMDLGCGLGRCGINLYHQLFSDHQTQFVFCDSELISHGGNQGGSRHCTEEEVATYNSVRKTASFAHLNGLKNYKVIDFNTENFLDGIPKMDLIVSMYSVGFHFSFTDWLPNLAKVLTKDTVLILGVSGTTLRLCNAVHDKHNYKPSNSSQSLEVVKGCFETVRIERGLRPPLPFCDYMILTGFRKSWRANDWWEYWSAQRQVV